jgi:hypothetical protein
MAQQGTPGVASEETQAKDASFTLRISAGAL